MLTPWPEGSLQNAFVMMSHPHLFLLPTSTVHLSQPPPATQRFPSMFSSFRHITHVIPSVMPLPPFLITVQAVHSLGRLPGLPRKTRSILMVSRLSRMKEVSSQVVFIVSLLTFLCNKLINVYVPHWSIPFLRVWIIPALFFVLP